MPRKYIRLIRRNIGGPRVSGLATLDKKRSGDAYSKNRRYPIIVYNIKEKGIMRGGDCSSSLSQARWLGL
jgi:hypothetical protein